MEVPLKVDKALDLVRSILHDEKKFEVWFYLIREAVFFILATIPRTFFVSNGWSSRRV